MQAEYALKQLQKTEKLQWARRNPPSETIRNTIN